MTPEQLADALEALADGPPWDTAWLRSLLPQLAVRGRLVAQEAEWSEDRLKSLVAELKPGFACSKKHQQDGGVVHLRTHNVDSTGRFNTDLLVTINPEKVDPKKHGIRKDDVIFNNTNSRELVGKSCVVPEDLDYAFSNHMTLLRPEDKITGTFLWCCLQNYWRSGYFERTCKAWIGQAGVDTKAVGALPIPVPPLTEQHRIVAKVDELMGHAAVVEERHLAATSARVRFRDAALHALAEAEDHEAVEAAWSRIEDHFDDLFTEPEDIQPLRQTILQLAVRGRLVAQEAGDGDAFALEEEVHRERERLWIRANQAKKKYAGKEEAEILVDYERPSHDPRPSHLTSLPDRWAVLSLEAITDPERVISYGILKPGEDQAGGTPYVKVRDIRDGVVLVNQLKRTTEEIHQKYKRSELVGGDLLVSIRGTVGKVAEVPGTLAGGNITQDTARIAVLQSVAASFVRLCLESPDLQQYFASESKGAAVQGLNIGSLRPSPIPLPPLAEQHRIVAKVDELMSLCDALETSLKRAKTTREQFSTSICHALTGPTAASA